MSSIAVIYWSMTGNTQAMAEAIAQGAREAGAQVDVFSVDQVGVDQVLEYDQLALGCPAMGAEVLEESEFEPFFSQLEGRLSGKVCGPLRLLRLGDGQWMRDWQDRVSGDGAQLFEEGLMANGAPDEAECEAFGKRFSAFKWVSLCIPFFGKPPDANRIRPRFRFNIAIKCHHKLLIGYSIRDGCRVPAASGSASPLTSNTAYKVLHTDIFFLSRRGPGRPAGAILLSPSFPAGSSWPACFL